MTDSTFPGATPIPCPLLQEFDGHGGICITDAEGRQLGYISSHPNQTLRAARVVDAVQDYDALRTERDALKDEVQRLREAGEAAKEGAVIDYDIECMSPGREGWVPFTNRWSNFSGTPDEALQFCRTCAPSSKFRLIQVTRIPVDSTAALRVP